MPEAKDLITEHNVIKTFTKNKSLCFVLKNGFTVTLNPNQVSTKGSGAAIRGGK